MAFDASYYFYEGKKNLFPFVEGQMFAIWQNFLSPNKLHNCTVLYYEYKFFKLRWSEFHFSQKYVSINCCGIGIGTSETCIDLLVALWTNFFVYLTCSLVDISGFAIYFVYRITRSLMLYVVP